jgi:hypothetical protein
MIQVAKKSHSDSQLLHVRGNRQIVVLKVKL